VGKDFNGEMEFPVQTGDFAPQKNHSNQALHMEFPPRANPFPLYVAGRRIKVEFPYCP
jgi:hypothetical protein